MIILTEITKKHYSICYRHANFIYEFNKYKKFIVCILKKDISYQITDYTRFKNYYIMYTYDNNILIMIRYFNYSGNLHRENGPAKIVYDKKSKIKSKKYYLHGCQKFY